MRETQENVERPRGGRKWFFWVGLAFLIIIGILWLLCMPALLSNPDIEVIIVLGVFSIIFITPNVILLIRGRHNTQTKISRRSMDDSGYEPFHIQNPEILNIESKYPNYLENPSISPKNIKSHSEQNTNALLSNPKKSYRMGTILLSIFSFSMIILFPLITSIPSVKIKLIIAIIPVALLVIPGIFFLIHGIKIAARKKIDTSSIISLTLPATLGLVVGALLVAMGFLAAIMAASGDTSITFREAGLWGLVGLVNIAGGICILLANGWLLTLIGSICILFPLGAGIPAVIVVALVTDQFVRQKREISKEVASSKYLPLDEAYKFGLEHKLQNEILNIQNMVIEELPVYQVAIRSGFIVDLFIQNGIFESFKDSCWPNGKTEDGEKRTNNYLNWKKSRLPDGTRREDLNINIPWGGFWSIVFILSILLVV